MLASLVAALALAQSTPAATQPVFPKQQMLETAQTIPLRSTAREVERITEGLGKPSIEYSWCNPAGCVDDVDGAKATRMSTLWVKDGGDSSYALFVAFCRDDAGEWKVGAVWMSERPTKPGAWGTTPKSSSVFRNTDNVFFHDRCWERR
jgi:hypothetical protein